ncbi:MAG: recombination regulator RecX [Ignavibacteria bacterium]|nr:recombination regulator RecX [Ignavibacteria bacterium]MBT8382521.1 recombination regulator RecX [Ignavibacteria bacterium]MBT8390839.1 recombination regulator RecX [Ignavibacteria bacterium]NNJ54207.1 regulatory protein RecX [Ignavibacteriaceae bacterium]NNL21221.1 regulatory protein RecX [Ignavibacteriaceae bacterium]
MHVTRIVKKGKNDVTIFLNDETVLILAVEVFLKSGLKKHDEISQDRYSILIEENKKFHIKQRAFRLLGRRQHSVKELRDKLWNKDYDKKLIDDVILKLIDSNYLDDKEFTSVFAEEKLRTKKWSKRRLKSELIKKGISSNLISEVLSSKISNNENFENALAVGLKKYESLQKRYSDIKEIRNKLTAFLISKGFDYDTIKEVYSELIKS